MVSLWLSHSVDSAWLQLEKTEPRATGMTGLRDGVHFHMPGVPDASCLPNRLSIMFPCLIMFACWRFWSLFSSKSSWKSLQSRPLNLPVQAHESNDKASKHCLAISWIIIIPHNSNVKPLSSFSHGSDHRDASPAEGLDLGVHAPCPPQGTDTFFGSAGWAAVIHKRVMLGHTPVPGRSGRKWRNLG